MRAFPASRSVELKCATDRASSVNSTGPRSRPVSSMPVMRTGPDASERLMMRANPSRCGLDADGNSVMVCGDAPATAPQTQAMHDTASTLTSRIAHHGFPLPLMSHSMTHLASGQEHTRRKVPVFGARFSTKEWTEKI